MFGRRGPTEAGFTPKELGEVRDLERCAAIVDSQQLPPNVDGDFDSRERGIKEKNLKILNELAEQSKPEKAITMNFQFYASPIEILGKERVEGIRLERTHVIDGKAQSTGELFDVPCCSVITAIGYQADPPEGLRLDGAILDNTNGWIEDNVYVVGWAKRGSNGTIPTNGPDSRAVIELLSDTLKNMSNANKGGYDSISKLLEARNIRTVSINDMKKIQAAEINNARKNHPWEKFTKIESMLEALN
jgi:ferredoxin--NADP+ reductase